MKKINDKELLNYYKEKFNIDSIFSVDMNKHMELFKFERGECICKTNDEMKYFYLHVKGKLKVYTMSDSGKSVLLRFNKPLSILGDVELLNEQLVKCYVDSLDESLLIGIKFEYIREYAYNDPVFLRFIIRNLSFKLYTVSNASSINLLYPLENRFASYLLSISSDENNSRVSEIKTNNLGEMANLLGSSYRHLSRVIKNLEMAGIIKNDKKRIAILDFEKLKKLAGENLYE
ncbi:Crp/Fnr family transcriptional regulator [Alkaliphilus peptidifermentans]|uniref:cAMP-binding domain of CRP or a regulatory subunit of cAMP-dependent protein kinases n=1 Tax=Alkaliphilus peptidifermentans DSM 18978 TaxID=1120976 RepID=A0A1G5KRM8_9FIRM|nr:helix-turn-helix domain-containing protein [Alkaliphilus peptidifermentans]SCZ03252.1 cAMP-binding domain of CRP or a regulatory subunit of cAMP-dependent protein kinases [Alkaliphilus peptidifermentans DSM 18978]